MKYNVAILGAGIGREHLNAYLALPSIFNVLMLVDRDFERAEKRCYGYDIEPSGDIADALDNPRIDIVDICLPPHLHKDTTLAALTAGKHVICEKPLATCMRDIQIIEAAAEQANRTVFPVFQYRWGPSLAKLRHLVATGMAGQPQIASLETHWSRGADYYSVPWRGTWAGEQGGAVLGHAIHNHDLMTHFMGPVKTVSAATTTRINPIETEDCAVITFELENGALASSNITLGAATNETRIRFVFEHLTATSGTEPYAPGIGDWIFTARNPDNQVKIDKALLEAPTEKIGFAGLFSCIHDHLSGKRNTAVTLQEGAASIALVTAIYAAARSGQRVTLPLTSAHTLYDGWTP